METIETIETVKTVEEVKYRAPLYVLSEEINTRKKLLDDYALKTDRNLRWAKNSKDTINTLRTDIERTKEAIDRVFMFYAEDSQPLVALKTGLKMLEKRLDIETTDQTRYLQSVKDYRLGIVRVNLEIVEIKNAVDIIKSIEGNEDHWSNHRDPGS